MPSPADSVEARAVMIDTWAQPAGRRDGGGGRGDGGHREGAGDTGDREGGDAPYPARLGGRMHGDSLLVGAERPLPPAGGFPPAGGCSGRPAVHTVVRAGLLHAYLRMSCLRVQSPGTHRHNCRPSIAATTRLTECRVNINRQLSLPAGIAGPGLVVSLVDSERRLTYKMQDQKKGPAATVQPGQWRPQWTDVTAPETGSSRSGLSCGFTKKSNIGSSSPAASLGQGRSDRPRSVVEVRPAATRG